VYCILDDFGWLGAIEAEHDPAEESVAG
jgi:hypothetical protein